MPKERACKECKRIFEPSVLQCPYCNGKTTENFSGFVGIIDAENSEIAKFLNIKENGIYAMKVR